MQPDKERVAELKKHPFVATWIKTAQASHLFGPYPDCHSCGWPHAPVLLCGCAQFGSVTFGGNQYNISAQNVEAMLAFVSEKRYGFHWINEIFFNVKDDCVIVTHIDQYNNSPQTKTWKIPLREWQSITDFVAARTAD